MDRHKHRPSTQKVRRRAAGGKPAGGHELQRQGRKVRRADPRGVALGRTDPKVTGIGGLAAFNAFTRALGLDRELGRGFDHLKTGRSVVYPMSAQMQLVLDAAVCGAGRVFGLEALAADPLFAHLAGGTVPSVDTIYNDLRRFGADELEELERIVSRHGLAGVGPGQFDEVHLDVDTTVMPLFVSQQGARRGHNPRYRGRPSHHPLLARLAETDTIVAARLRPGDTGLGEADIEDVEVAIDRVREAVGPDTVITVRIDAGGDCAALLDAIDKKGCLFLVKAKQTARLLGLVAATTEWTTVDTDAEDQPTRQVAEIDYRRAGWPEDKRYRLIVVRTNTRDTGRQVYLWEGLDYSVQLYVTNDHARDANDLAFEYDKRAGIEPTIGELKHGLGIGKASSASFAANEAAFLLKILALNLMRRWIAQAVPAAARWRMPWIRELFVRIPGRLLRVGGRWQLRLSRPPMLG